MKKFPISNEYCDSNGIDEQEKDFCHNITVLFGEMLEDLENKGFLRTELRSENANRALITKVMLNVIKITKAFNNWFDVYADRAKPNSQQKLRKILEIGELTEEDAVFLLFSDMIFVFLQNIEELRYAMLHTLKLPIIKKSDKVKIEEDTTLNKLLISLENLKVKNTSKLRSFVDGGLRNGLSHGLFWFEAKDGECSELHLHYSKDSEFNIISKPIGISELFLITRKQSIYTNCLLNVIADWFSDTV